MLKKIRVKNFKCFKDLTFDLTASDYSFNQELVKDGIVNKALIYGKNGSGKTSLGLAIFDIVQHLTDKQKLSEKFLEYYSNLNESKEEVSFTYTFSFSCGEVTYSYGKSRSMELLYEKIKVGRKVLIDYDYRNSEKQFVDDTLKGTLNVSLPDNKLSVIKYIYNNTPSGTSPILTELMNFCNGMLWFRSSSDGNTYCGLKNGGEILDEALFKSEKLKDFQSFLKKFDLPYDLDFEVNNGCHTLYAYFDKRKNKAIFSFIASAGTRALWLLFYWYSVVGKDNLSFMFIDEFDAFYHYEAAKEVVKLLNGNSEIQTILTTHDTYLMQNQFTRPDCCFLITKKAIKCLKNSTERELREAHNLETLYVNGAFSE